MPEVRNDQAIFALEFQAVGKAFMAGRHSVNALRNVSLALPQGTVAGLVGPDGAGKTTLMRLAAGLLLPDSGRVVVFGHGTDSDTEPLRGLIGYMPQRFGLYEDLSVAENLALYADLHGIDRRERAQRFQELTLMTGLAPFTARLAGRLSGGMKQKLGLACTLLSRPRLLLLDEPSVGVDPVSRRELWNIIDQQVKTSGTTVLLSTAYLDEAERCTDVMLLDEGELLDHGSPEAFQRKIRGRCYRITHPELSNRDLQNRLSGQPGIVDAVIQGEAVRVVCDSEDSAGAVLAGTDTGKLRIEPAAPRLEDAFIELLNQRRAPVRQANEMAGPAAPVADEEIIRVDGVDRWFGDFQAVKKLSFTVRRGEIFGLLGANGAGKTTTFRMLCGLLPASSGRLQVAGVDLRKAAARARARIGYMSQKFSLYANLSVSQNLAFFSSVYGLRDDRRDERIRWALRQFELEARKDANSGDLPLGYKQRLAMACALMHEPEILFLDEPTSGVDPLARREFWNRTNRLAAAGVTVLVTTHFMEEAEYCDRLVIMAEGDILTAGTPADIKRQARTEALPDPTMEDAFIQLIQAKQS
ncbi:MAG: ATP-binding cassette domain-containing protein [Methylobacter sp.]|uniref:ATP-binding cassette domain-containing protein n=1 Tax=Methylobacter sp. TaxID=2051955 RepID=UPI00258910A5|nr:ATP-binding cassette domain-containing protein [Methylobacter sp.]MCL7421205.1 ATP-binding cassette domain-containing protein [Methylobacter sp.]